jgi:hypothetical protein
MDSFHWDPLLRMACNHTIPLLHVARSHAGPLLQVARSRANPLLHAARRVRAMPTCHPLARPTCPSSVRQFRPSEINLWCLWLASLSSHHCQPVCGLPSYRHDSSARNLLVAGFLLLVIARSLLSRGWHLEMEQFSGFISHTMPCQPEGLGI